MKYVVSKKVPNRPNHPSTIWTWDEKVVKATPAFNWAVGKKISYIYDWLIEHGWEVTIHE